MRHGNSKRLHASNARKKINRVSALFLCKEKSYSRTALDLCAPGGTLLHSEPDDKRKRAESASSLWRVVDGVVTDCDRYGRDRLPIAMWLLTLRKAKRMERAKGIEPSSSAWEADALPLCYARTTEGILAGSATKSSQTSALILHNVLLRGQ
jgi:hypothetical protein